MRYLLLTAALAMNMQAMVAQSKEQRHAEKRGL